MKGRAALSSTTLVFLSFLLATGCTYSANVAPTSAAAAEILPNRTINRSASIYVAPELSSIMRTAQPSYVCSAHTFPVNAGPAIQSSILSTNEAAFSGIIPGGTRSTGAPGAYRHIVFDLESFNPRLDFTETFASGRALANAELLMRVTVLDERNNPILRTVVSGQGSSERDGFCPVGAQALQEATSLAIRRALENYVFRVINSQQI